MEIVFVSDYVCPYCLVAKESLKQALKETGINATITWIPFELTCEPKERVDTYHDEIRKAKYQILVEPCKKLGIDMKLPPKVIPRPYTRLAFEGWHYACTKGCGEEYNEEVYKAYFIEEKDIGDISVLKEIASNVGLEEEMFEEVLNQKMYSQKQKEEDEYAKNILQVKGVPSIYVNGEKISIQKFTKEEMIEILQGKIVEEKETMMACGIDGCK